MIMKRKKTELPHEDIAFLGHIRTPQEVYTVVNIIW
jgi:hypothetical protein